MLESEMMEICYTFLSQCEDILFVKKEVPFLSRCIDIVYIKNNQVISIELKVHDWRRAIEQAINHQLGADKSYICLPKRKLTENLCAALKSSGIGLMFFDKEEQQPIYEVIAASKKANTIPAFKEMLISNMSKI